MTVVAPGINGKMSEINAAFGLLQLKHVERAIARRREIDGLYRSLLAGLDGITCVAPTGQDASNCSYFPILVGADYGISRDELFDLMRQNDVVARRYFFPLISSFPVYRGLPSAAPENLPVAAERAAQVICLPIYPAMTDADAMRVATIIRSRRRLLLSA